MKKNLIKTMMIVGSMCMFFVMGCGAKTANSEKKDDKKQEIGEIEEVEDTVPSDSGEVEEIEETEEPEIKYPVGVEKGGFYGYKYEKDDRIESVYYYGNTQMKSRYLEYNSGVTMVFSYTYDENGKISAYEVHRQHDDLLAETGVIEEGKVIATTYDEKGNATVSEFYLDQYGMVIKHVYGNKVYENTYDYQFYDNGNIKCITKTGGPSVLVGGINRQYKGIMYWPEGIVEFDENGNMIRTVNSTPKGDLCATWTYDENGWVVEESQDEFGGDGINKDNYTWTYSEWDR